MDIQICRCFKNIPTRSVMRSCWAVSWSTTETGLCYFAETVNFAKRYFTSKWLDFDTLLRKSRRRHIHLRSFIVNRCQGSSQPKGAHCMFCRMRFPLLVKRSIVFSLRAHEGEFKWLVHTSWKLIMGNHDNKGEFTTKRSLKSAETNSPIKALFG